MAMKVVTPTPINFAKLTVAAAVMRAAHVLAKGWMAAQKHLVGDYQDFLRLALRLAWDLARGRQPRVPTWAMAMAIPAEAKALSEVGIATPRASFEVAEGENPFAAFRRQFGVAARWGWPTAKIPAYWAAEIAAAHVVATCHQDGKEYTYWSY